MNFGIRLPPFPPRAGAEIDEPERQPPLANPLAQIGVRRGRLNRIWRLLGHTHETGHTSPFTRNNGNGTVEA